MLIINYLRQKYPFRYTDEKEKESKLVGLEVLVHPYVTITPVPFCSNEAKLFLR